MTETPVFLAVVQEADTVDFTVCATRDDALHWLVGKIKQPDWERFYDSLDMAVAMGVPHKKDPRVTRDRSGMSPEFQIEVWLGDKDPEQDFWGDGDNSFAIVKQDDLYRRPEGS